MKIAIVIEKMWKFSHLSNVCTPRSLNTNWKFNQRTIIQNPKWIRNDRKQFTDYKSQNSNDGNKKSFPNDNKFRFSSSKLWPIVLGPSVVIGSAAIW